MIENRKLQIKKKGNQVVSKLLILYLGTNCFFLMKLM